MPSKLWTICPSFLHRANNFFNHRSAVGHFGFKLNEIIISIVPITKSSPSHGSDGECMRLTEALVGSRVSHILGIPDPYQTTSTRHISSMEMLRMMMVMMLMMLMMMMRRRIIMIFRWTEVAVVMLIINPNSSRDTSDLIMRMNTMIMILTFMIHLIWWYLEYYDYDYCDMIWKCLWL